MKTYDEIYQDHQDGKNSLAARSWAAGYMWRGPRVCPEPIVEEYAGRYGRGYKVHHATHNSKRFHTVEYYIYA